MRTYLASFVIGSGFILTASVALAQGSYRTSDPNMNHFYMGRQEWQYIDQSPVITGQPSVPAAQTGQGAGPAGGAPPLPKAGWVPYSSTIPSVQNALPKVNNGVPKAAPPVPASKTSGMHSKAGALKPKPKPQAPSGPATVQTYTPYKGYGTNNPTQGKANGSTQSSTSTNVKGSILHWARPKPQSY